MRRLHEDLFRDTHERTFVDSNSPHGQRNGGRHKHREDNSDTAAVSRPPGLASQF